MEWIYLNWNAGSILFFFIVSLMLWLVGQTKDVSQKVKHPEFLGVASSLISYFDVGLYCIVVLAFYLWFIWFIKKYLGKYFEKLKINE